MESMINTINGIVWATPMTVMLLSLSIYFCIRMKFGTIRNFKMQIKLLFSGNSGSEEGISSFEAFCSVAAYRVAVGNVGGVCVAIMAGGPGAAVWMMIASVLSTGIAYAENSLGQIYKVRKDGQYRGGPYYYIQNAMNMKWLAVTYALLITVSMALFVVGPSANNIGMAMENSFGINPYISGAIVAVLLFVVISGGIRRIATFSTIIVPIMSVVYLLVGLIVIIANISTIPATLALIFTSAFNGSAVFGGMIGAALSYGVKRAIMSSGAGMGESVPAAAAAETAHPAEQGIVNAFSVYIDLAVCLTTAVIAIASDCYNVLTDTVTYIGQGSAVMAEQAATGTAGVVWIQEGASTVMPGIGGIIIAFCLTFFAFSTSVAYYYESETALAYLMENKSDEARKKVIKVLRIVMPIMFVYWAGVSASLAWSVSEICFGLMIWVNCAALIYLSKTVVITYADYMEQYKAGKKPYFNPQKLGIKNVDVWMDINKEYIEQDQ